LEGTSIFQEFGCCLFFIFFFYGSFQSLPWQLSTVMALQGVSISMQMVYNEVRGSLVVTVTASQIRSVLDHPFEQELLPFRHSVSKDK
jgi:hypothetical protein